MRDYFALLAGKLTYFVSQFLKLGAGGTWPGETALSISPKIMQSLAGQLKRGVILVAGTNGKTTTSLIIKQILEAHGEQVVHNSTGANLLNGVISALVKKCNWIGKVDADWGVFETDENSLPVVLRELDFYSSSDPSTNGEGESRSYIKESSRLRSNNKALIVVLLNLFRDQLDRYGEVDVIIEKWQKALQFIPESALLVLNSDDPQVAYLGHASKARIVYFGINDTKLARTTKEHATDSLFCPKCGNRLRYERIYFSHLGLWDCQKCGLKRPVPQLTEWKSPLPGVYNLYNTLAAVSVAQGLTFSDTKIKQVLDKFTPAFGRQEEFKVGYKKIKLFLSKNPVGFNESLKTVISLGAKNILLVLNDRIPDGRDVSWIWDVDFEMLTQDEHVKKKHDERQIIVSGDRVYDLALRIKYLGHERLDIQPDLAKAIKVGLIKTRKGKELYVLPTYSGMLETRKYLIGKKIL